MAEGCPVDAGLALCLHSGHGEPPARGHELPFSRKSRFKHNQHLRPINRHFYGTLDLWLLRALLSGSQDHTPRIAPELWKEKTSC